MTDHRSFGANFSQPANGRSSSRRRAAAAVLVLVTLLPVLGVAALCIDVGYIYSVRADLQLTTDAAAHAGSLQLPNRAAARETALESARANYPNHGTVVATSDIHLGNWDLDSNVFTVGEEPINAVRVVARRSQQNGNPVGLFFARIFGKHDTDISAAATAYSPTSGVRFLIDDEMFDTDIPAIEDFAAVMGVSSDDLLTDADGDGFIDFPPTVIELPTGQVGDEALFDIGSGFPFTSGSGPSLEDFLLFEEGGDQHGIDTGDLDPLTGVEPVSDPGQYPDFVDPNAVLVSPVYRNDVSDTDPGVNALGERRGLVAFKILAVGSDPDGGGSLLPNLVVEIVDPSTLDPPSGARLVTEGGSGLVELVQ